MVRNIRGIIVDDESSSVYALQSLLEIHAPYITIEATATTPEDALNIIRNFKPELAFLDIEMPGTNAFELLDKLAPIKFEIIFVTAYQAHAAKAFRYAAIDYLVKPIILTDLMQALDKAKRKMEEKKKFQAKSLQQSGGKALIGDSEKLPLPSSNGTRFVDINSIIYLKAEGSYTSVMLQNKPKELTSRGLKEFEEMLPENKFCRVHHSYIINIDFVAKYIKGRGGHVEMTDGRIVEISVRKKADFMARFLH